TVNFDGTKAEIIKQTETRLLESDISGPHGIAFSPDRKSFFVSIGHGRPYGSAVKYDAETDAASGQVQLGLFPAPKGVSPRRGFVYIVNFKLHGDPVPSSVSVVDAKMMVESARIPTCVMPHGSRVTADGSRQYSGCMMDDLLVEIDARRMKLVRTFRLTKGHEAGFTGLPPRDSAVATSASGAHSMDMSAATCQPTWAQPSVDGKRVYVACNKSSEIVEVDATNWTLVRRIPAGEGVYNLGISPDGKLLVATNKRGPSTSVFDIGTAAELARLKT